MNIVIAEIGIENMQNNWYNNVDLQIRVLGAARTGSHVNRELEWRTSQKSIPI
jgi:hypothetical protein